MLKREKYLSMIRPYYDSELIKVICGVRRCGKSTIVKQIVDELSVEHGGDCIIYYDFESFDNEVFLDDPHHFYDRIREQTEDGKKYYIFIDEVQYMKDFEKVIASIRANVRCSLFVTGSSSNLLAGSLAARLTGRTIEFHITPFSYREALEYTGRDKRELFLDYMRWGGFPLRFNEHIDERRFSYDLFNSILKRDIFDRHDVADKRVFRNFASYVMTRTGETITSESISGYTHSVGDDISRTTCGKYLDYLGEAYLVSECSRFDIKGKKALESRSKRYAVDPSFVTIQTGKGDNNLGFMLETIVYNELLSRGLNVYIGKTYNGEVDFVVTDLEGRTAYIQVCYLLATDEVIRREFSAFSSVKDNFPKYVLSLDEMDFSRDGIKHMNVISFLLSDASLF